MQERGPAAPLTGRRAPAAVIGAVAALVVAVDQLTKSWAVATLADRDIHVVWTLRLHLVFNSGAAFSFGTGNPWLFAAAAAVLVAGMFWWGRGVRSRRVLVALGCIVGGALGNLADRLLRGHGGAVVDWIDLQWWPVFNVADASIVLGAVALVLAARELDAAAA